MKNKKNDIIKIFGYKLTIEVKWSGNILLPPVKDPSNRYKNYCYRWCLKISKIK